MAGPIAIYPNTNGEKALHLFANGVLAFGMGGALAMTKSPWLVGGIGAACTAVGAYLGLDAGLGIGLGAGLLARGIRNVTPIVKSISSGGSLPGDALTFLVPGAQLAVGTITAALYLNSERKRVWVRRDIDSMDRCMVDPIQCRG